MRARVSPSVHPKVFSCRVPFLTQSSLFPGLRTDSEDAPIAACSSHTDVSVSNPIRTPQGVFMPCALPDAILSTSRLEDRLGRCWLAYPEYWWKILLIYVYICLLLTSNVHPRCCLHSADLAMLVVPSTRLSTHGYHAFPVASARAWNSLPSSVRNAPSLTTFRRELKTVHFRSSFDND